MVGETVGLLHFRRQKTMQIDKGRPVAEGRYVVVDTELTGLDERRDSLVSIGAFRMIGGRIDVGDSFYRLIRPETTLTAESVVIHGITPSDVVEKPDVETVLNEFIHFCGDDILVGHCISIDLAFLNREMKRFFGLTLRNPVVDTVALYALAGERMSGHGTFVSPPRDYSKLYDIARSLGIPVNGAHNALMDAFITAQVFQRLIPMLHSLGIRSLGSLLKINLRGGDAYRGTGSMFCL